MCDSVSTLRGDDLIVYGDLYRNWRAGFLHPDNLDADVQRDCEVEMKTLLFLVLAGFAVSASAKYVWSVPVNAHPTKNGFPTFVGCGPIVVVSTDSDDFSGEAVIGSGAGNECTIVQNRAVQTELLMYCELPRGWNKNGLFCAQSNWHSISCATHDGESPCPFGTLIRWYDKHRMDRLREWVKIR